MKANRAVFLFVLVFACATELHNEESDSKEVSIIESKQEIDFVSNDLAPNEYMFEELRLVRENYFEITSIENWDEVVHNQVDDGYESGKASFFYNNNQLRKIRAHYFGNLNQTMVEYFLLEGELSFVKESIYNNNQPLYQYSNELEEEFDIEKTDTLETMNFFLDGKLVHLLESGDCGAPFATEYLEMQENRLKAMFDRHF